MPRPAAQAMALRHADGVVEVACNLLDSHVSPPAAVQERLERLAADMGARQAGPGEVAAGGTVAGVAGLRAAGGGTRVVVRQGYQTNKSPEQLLRAALAAGLEAA